MMRRLKVLAGCSLLLLFFTSPCFADHIDNYEEGAFGLSVSSGGPFVDTASQVQSSGANGGLRTVRAIFSSGSGSAFASLTPGAFDDSFILGVDSTANAAFLFEYDTTNADLLNIPSSVGDWDRLSLDYITNTSGMASVTVETNGSFSSQSVAFGPGTGTLDFAYSSFAGTIDFSDIDSIALTLPISGNGAFGPSSFSSSLFYRNGFVVVPEPGTAGLAGACLVGMMLRRRRS